MTSKDRSKRGFSLTELLTVLAIVALLAALLLGAILGANRKARNIQCASNLKQLGLGLSVFVSDFHVYPLTGNPGFSKGLCDGHVETVVLRSLFEEANDATLKRWNRDDQSHSERLQP